MIWRVINDEHCLLQVVVCSFVYGGSKIKSKQVAAPENDKNSTPQPSNKSATQIYPPASQNFPPSAMNAWSGFRTADLRNPHPDIDLTRGWWFAATNTWCFVHMCCCKCTVCENHKHLRFHLVCPLGARVCANLVYNRVISRFSNNKCGN